MTEPKEATPVTFIEEQTALGDWVWTHRCWHGEVTSLEAFRKFSDELVKGAFMHASLELPAEVPDELVAQVAVRILLGRLAEMRFGCPCGLQAFRLLELPGADAGDHPC